MLVASRQIGLLDRYRVPYSVVPGEPGDLVRIGRADGKGPELLAIGPRSTHGVQPSLFEGAVLYASLSTPATVSTTLAATNMEWADELSIVDLAGTKRAAMQTSTNGSIFLPFDLDEPLDALLEERYHPAANRLHEAASLVYYAVRPILPRRLQFALRRYFRRVQERAAFPSWPVETSLHRLEAVLLSLVERIAGEPLPWLASWPSPYTSAVVLTHDVERTVGYLNIPAVREVEARYGLRSAWYFVPERDYSVEESLLDQLRADGCEIGLHGLHHDGRDMTRTHFPKRLAAMRGYAERWHVQGFRGPSTHRDKRLIRQLGVEHDSSWSDVARYEPQPGGCCSWLPYFLDGDLVELPITLAQDHTLFELLGEADEASWVSKASFLRSQEGMVLVLTHPDYLNSPERLESYERLLAKESGEPGAWQALPHEVAEWWQRRGATTIERDGDSWTAAGPAAAEARLRIGAPSPPAPSAAG